MQRVERSARIGAAPEEVFAYLADLAHLPEWQAGVTSAEMTSSGELGVGSTAHVVRQVMGQRIEAPLTITEFEPPHRLVIGSEVSGVAAVAQLDLAAADGFATDLRFAMEIRGSGVTRFMESMIAGAAGGDIDQSIRRVQERFATGR
jgi:uncharacterized protein YndB with AHSA1/START domain